MEFEDKFRESLCCMLQKQVGSAFRSREASTQSLRLLVYPESVRPWGINSLVS